jgi:hypothetical protein
MPAGFSFAASSHFMPMDEDNGAFDALMRAFGFRDHVEYDPWEGFYRYEHYTDGAWLEGIRITPVVYWAA